MGPWRSAAPPQRIKSQNWAWSCARPSRVGRVCFKQGCQALSRARPAGLEQQLITWAEPLQAAGSRACSARGLPETCLGKVGCTAAPMASPSSPSSTITQAIEAQFGPALRSPGAGRGCGRRVSRHRSQADEGEAAFSLPAARLGAAGVFSPLPAPIFNFFF